MLPGAPGLTRASLHVEVSFKCIAPRCRLLTLEIDSLHRAIREAGLAEAERERGRTEGRNRRALGTNERSKEKEKKDRRSNLEERGS